MDMCMYIFCRNLSAIQDREICCYSISCKEKENIGIYISYLFPFYESFLSFFLVLQVHLKCTFFISFGYFSTPFETYRKWYKFISDYENYLLLSYA